LSHLVLNQVFGTQHTSWKPFTFCRETTPTKSTVLTLILETRVWEKYLKMMDCLRVFILRMASSTFNAGIPSLSTNTLSSWSATKGWKKNHRQYWDPLDQG
jgi:hypothetical protein